MFLIWTKLCSTVRQKWNWLQNYVVATTSNFNLNKFRKIAAFLRQFETSELPTVKQQFFSTGFYILPYEGNFQTWNLVLMHWFSLFFNELVSFEFEHCSLWFSYLENTDTWRRNHIIFQTHSLYTVKSWSSICNLVENCLLNEDNPLYWRVTRKH